MIGKLTTKRQGLPTELKTELLAKGYTGNSRVGTSGLEKQYEDMKILVGTKSLNEKIANDERFVVI